MKRKIFTKDAPKDAQLLPKMTCPECGGPLKRETRKIEYTRKGKSVTVDQPGSWCQVCPDEGILEPEDLAATREERFISDTKE